MQTRSDKGPVGLRSVCNQREEGVFVGSRCPPTMGVKSPGSCFLSVEPEMAATLPNTR